MWRWPVVAKKKDVSNALRQKVFSLHAKLIALAAMKWSDPSLNPSLYDAIEKARKDNLPNDNIERAIRKGSGEDVNAEQISQIVYEWYAPGGVAVIVSVLTDNRNRTAANIRHIFSKFWGSMGESGSVSWIFHRKWILDFDTSSVDGAKLEELAFETDVDDIQTEEGRVRMFTQLENFSKVKKFFEEKWFSPDHSATEFIPSNFVDVTEFEKALKITKMIEALDEDEDVEDYSLNFNIEDALQNEVDAFIEKNTFRT